MASFTYNDFRVVRKRAGFETLRCLAEIKMLDCKTLVCARGQQSVLVSDLGLREGVLIDLASMMRGDT